MGLKKQITDQPSAAKDFARAATPAPFHLAFSLLPRAPADNVEAPRGGPQKDGIQKDSIVNRYPEASDAKLNAVPLIDFSKFRREVDGQYLYPVDIGNDCLLLSEKRAFHLHAAIYDYIGRGGNYLWLVPETCAINMSLVTAVRPVSFGRAIRIDFPGGKRVGISMPRERVKYIMARYTSWRRHRRTPPAHPSGGPGA